MLMHEALVTFVVPTFNAMPHIVASVRSIQSQTISDFFAIIIDDSSTDDTHAFLRSLRDERFRIIHRDRPRKGEHANAGLVDALNFAIREVKTKYIARLDADDVALPRRIETQLGLLETTPDLAALGTRMGYIYGRSRHFGLGFGGYAIRPSFAPPMSNPPFWDPVKDGQTIPHPSATIRSDAFHAVGGYRSNAPAEDVDLWLRLHDAGYKLGCINETLTLYRLSPSSISNTHFMKLAQSVAYVNHCRKCRIHKQPEPAFEPYVEKHPLSVSQVAEIQTQLRLRVAMGLLLSGETVRGIAELIRLMLTHPRIFAGKAKARCQ
jgi:glycosyltransferase involved in cell wall biosynthesis